MGDWHPYRVRSGQRPAGPSLTGPQRKALAALAVLCDAPGADASAKAVAEEAGLRHGNAVVILRSLAAKALVLVHEGEPEAFAPTMTGRSLARSLEDDDDRRRFERPDEPGR